MAMKDSVSRVDFIATSRNVDDFLCQLFEPCVLCATHSDNAFISFTKNQARPSIRTQKLSETMRNGIVRLVLVDINLKPSPQPLDTSLLVFEQTILQNTTSPPCLCISAGRIKVVIERCHRENGCSRGTTLNTVNPELNLFIDIMFKRTICSAPFFLIGEVIALVFFIRVRIKLECPRLVGHRWLSLQSGPICSSHIPHKNIERARGEKEFVRCMVHMLTCKVKTTEFDINITACLCELFVLQLDTGIDMLEAGVFFRVPRVNIDTHRSLDMRWDHSITAFDQTLDHTRLTHHGHTHKNNLKRVIHRFTGVDDFIWHLAVVSTRVYRIVEGFKSGDIFSCLHNYIV
mmetsp:Transcript_13312/g.25236  ORF Transcript_13312/g.25236 Transcript_13312/m.25236 type:complete len:346 (-) Transcript_13312:1796-2833(-)